MIVKAGDTVVWVNKDPFPHTVTSQAGGCDSPEIVPGSLDVRFISSLPVMQGNVYKAWVDSKPVQMVRAGD
jgi:plastocyanin